jgi:2-polyprenyl-3-methyl-5-hydroxy-6-metoxy-1,4-benzoquinol methylase
VIDVGAGIGSTAKVLNFKKFKRWVELEPDQTHVKKIRQDQIRGLIPEYYEVRCGMLRDIAQKEVFDTILYIDVLEHIESDSEELLLAERYLSTKGNIIILAPAHPFLFTIFDQRVGHFRRYNKKTMESISPPNLKVINLRYLDSIGMIASFLNKSFLRSDSPKPSHIKLWDRILVRTSRKFDKILSYNLGKSIVCVLQKVNQ